MVFSTLRPYVESSISLLDVLHCTSNVWIDSGIVPGQSAIEIDMDVQYNGNLGVECWFSTINKTRSPTSAGGFLQFGIWSNLFTIHLTSVTVNGTEAADNQRHNVVFTLNGSTATLTVDQTYTETNSQFQSGSFRDTSIAFGGYVYDIYSTTIKKDGQVVRDYVPATDSKTGKSGLLDQQTMTFFPME